MKKKKFQKSGMIILLILTLFINATSALATEKDKPNLQVENNTTTNGELTDTLSKNITKEIENEKVLSLFQDVQSGLNITISILNSVTSAIGVLIALITIILTIAVTAGFFEFRRWKKIREDIEGYKKQIQESKEEIEEIKRSTQSCCDEATKYSTETAVSYEQIKIIDSQLSPIASRIKEIEAEIINSRNSIMYSNIQEHATEETKSKLDQLAKKIELMENFGFRLTVEDYLTKGRDFWLKGRFEEALFAIEKVLELNPNDKDAWFNKGLILGRLQRLEEGLEAYKRAYELDPEDFEVMNNISFALTKLGFHKEALELIDLALEKKQDNFYLWDTKGTILKNLGRNKEAIEAYDKAICINPDYIEPLFNLSCVNVIENDIENAIKNLEKAIAINHEVIKMVESCEDLKLLKNHRDYLTIVNNNKNNKKKE